MAASFPAVTSCMANPDGSAAIPRVLLQKLPWGLLCLLLQRFHVRRGGGGRGCPSYAVIQPGATSSVNILLSGAQGHPAVFLRDSMPCPGWCSKSLVVIFFPTEFVQLRAFSWNSVSFLWTCPQNYLFSRKMNVHNSLFCTLIIGRLFLSKEDLALWSHPWEQFIRSSNYITSSNIYMFLFLKGIVP